MTTELVESQLKTYDIPIDDIFCDNDFNCRGPIPPIDVVDLARSIDANGLQQPITVQPWTKMPNKKYRIISGHRRFQAHRVNAAKTIPAILKEGMTELQARKLNLEENLKRKDLNILQEATALRPFWEAGWTQEMMCSELTQSRGWLQARIALLQLPPEIQQEAAAGYLTQEHIKQLASIKQKDAQFEAVKKIKSAKINNERGKIRAVPKKKNPLAKRPRDRQEGFAMMETIQDAVGNGFYTRCMAWVLGEISDFELLRDTKEFAESQGKRWEIPQSILKDVNF